MRLRSTTSAYSVSRSACCSAMIAACSAGVGERRVQDAGFSGRLAAAGLGLFAATLGGSAHIREFRALNRYPFARVSVAGARAPTVIGGSVEPVRQAKWPASRLAGGYGHPLHPAAVAIPIGCWTASLVFDLASRFVSDGAFLTRGSRWLIALGVLGALAAAMLGFLDFFAIPPGTRAFRTATVHMSLNLAVTTSYTISYLLRHGATPRVSWGLIALSLVNLAALTMSGYLGGKLAYRYGVRVADETTQLEGYQDSPATEKEEI